MVDAGVGGDAGAQAADGGPEAGIAVGPGPLEHPPAEIGASPGRDPLEGGRHVERVVEAEDRLLRLLHAGSDRGEVRVDEVAQLRLRGLVEAAGDAAPRDEERLPAASLAREGEPLVDERRERRHAGGVEGVAEARTQTPAGEEPEHALVIEGATAAARERDERVEERPAHLARPLASFAERALELAQEVLGFATRRVGTRLAERRSPGDRTPDRACGGASTGTAADGSSSRRGGAGRRAGSGALRSAAGRRFLAGSRRGRPRRRRDRRSRPA